MKRTIEQRFHKHIRPRRSGCVEWIGGRDADGYGRFYFNSKMMSAHRVSWTLNRGKIPDGLFVLHKCDNPCCVNPDHLFLGTHQDNMTDKKLKGRNRNQIGELNPCCKLTELNILEIRELYKRGLSQTNIGKRFEIHQAYVSEIILKKVWSHI